MSSNNIEKLNELLGQEIGRTPLGDPLYKWEWSDDLLWPAYATGRNTTRNAPAPIIGSDEVENVPMTVPEYKSDRQTIKRGIWMVTKWFSTAELLAMNWTQQFPQAEYPSRGWRIFTDWYNAPGVLPSLNDTRILIYALRDQLGLTEKQLGDEMAVEDEKRRKEAERPVDDCILDCVPAFVNGRPGKRGGHVSFGGINATLID